MRAMTLWTNRTISFAGSAANGGAIEPVSTRARFLTLDMMPREPHLLDYLLILRKHQWLILSFLLAVVTIVTIGTFRMQPVYEATTRIEIDRENRVSFLSPGAIAQYDAYEDLDNYIETQSKILTSETLAQQTIKSLHLDQDPRFGGEAKDPDKLEVVTPTKGPQIATPALGAFLGGLTVKRVPNSRLLDVTFATTDPKLAADIVNAHINNFIEQNFRSRYEATTQASNWLAGQLDELKSKVENCRRRAHQLRARQSDLDHRRKTRRHHAKACATSTKSSPTRRPIASTRKPSTSWRSPEITTRFPPCGKAPSFRTSSSSRATLARNTPMP